MSFKGAMIMSDSQKSLLYEKVYNHTIFENISKEEFETFIADCQLKFYKRSEKLVYFKTPEEGIILILDGKAEMFIESDAGFSVLLEVLQEGEMVGLSHIAYYLGESRDVLRQHRLELEFVEDSYCLQIPASIIKNRLTSPSVREFILREMSIRLGSVYSSLGERTKLSDEWGESEPFIQRAKDLMYTPVVTIDLNMSIQDIAKVMNEQSISSVTVLNQDKQLIGIITKSDLVQRVLSEGLSYSLSAADIMTVKPYTVSPYNHYYEVLSTFYNHRIKHLPVVEHNKVVGMITFRNLISKRDRGAMGILKTIEEASYDKLPIVKNAIYDVLTSLINDEISTIHTLDIITKFYDRLARHCLKLAVQSLDQKGIGLPPVPFAWYQMGSGARGEQFMLTDQDHFLVYANSETPEVKDYFRKLGEEIVIHLEQAGYKRCDGKMMASEEIWRGSIAEWQKRLQEWSVQTTDEQILLSYNFLSFRFLFGDRTIDKNFTQMVQHQLRSAQTLLYYMAQQEQNNPIPQFETSFFKVFKPKDKNESIDIKLHALFPLHHCLQILGTLHNLINQTPLQLLDSLIEAKEFTDEFASDIRHAYEVALKTRIQLSWAKHLRGDPIKTRIEFNNLRHWEQDELKTMLKTVHTLQMHLLKKL